MTSLDCFICPASSPKTRDYYHKWQRETTEKLEPATVWHLSLKNWGKQWIKQFIYFAKLEIDWLITEALITTNHITATVQKQPACRRHPSTWGGQTRAFGRFQSRSAPRALSERRGSKRQNTVFMNSFMARQQWSSRSGARLGFHQTTWLITAFTCRPTCDSFLHSLTRRKTQQGPSESRQAGRKTHWTTSRSASMRVGFFFY